MALEDNCSVRGFKEFILAVHTAGFPPKSRYRFQLPVRTLDGAGCAGCDGVSPAITAS